MAPSLESANQAIKKVGEGVREGIVKLIISSKPIEEPPASSGPGTGSDDGGESGVGPPSGGGSVGTLSQTSLLGKELSDVLKEKFDGKIEIEIDIDGDSETLDLELLDPLNCFF